MIFFGSFELPHVLKLSRTKQRGEAERIVPYRGVAYRMSETGLGETITVSGEIREADISTAMFRLEMIRRLNDGVTRTFDAGDADATTEAKLIDPQFILDVEDWFGGKRHIAYTVTVLESSELPT